MLFCDHRTGFSKQFNRGVDKEACNKNKLDIYIFQIREQNLPAPKIYTTQKHHAQIYSDMNLTKQSSILTENHEKWMLCISVCRNKVFNYCFRVITWTILVTPVERNTKEKYLLVTQVCLERKQLFINIWIICDVLVWWFVVFLKKKNQIETVIALILITN